MSQTNQNEAISVVIATFNRPDTLCVALQSVAFQDRTVDEILVIGDHCDTRTGEVVRSMGLQALRYINLPVRCGEQAIPNAVGTALARGKWIAYLNHDDVWAPEYLSSALQSLTNSGKRWHVGHSYYSYGADSDGDSVQFSFSDRTPPTRKAEWAFSKSAIYMEPVSSWLLEKSLALAIGNWRPAWKTRRTPTADFSLRLFRAVGEPSTASVPKVFKLPSAITGGELSYAGTSSAHAHIAQLMKLHGASFVDHLRLEEGRRINREGNLTWGEPEPVRWRSLHRWLRSQQRHWLYLHWGVDCPAISAALLGFRKGAHLRRALKSRTGENQLPRHDARRIIDMVSRSHNQ